MSFFKDLLGTTAARNAENLGRRNATQIGQGYDQADAYGQEGYGRAMGFYAPYAESGRRGQTAYEDTLGLNGADARQRQFQQGYLDDPALAYRNQQTGQEINNLLRKYNAGPQGVNSGAAALGVGRIRSESFDRDWGGFQNRLMQLGQQGQQIAGAQAGMTAQHYGGMADRAVGRANALVGNDTNATMAANNARQGGINNLLNIFGTVAGAASRMAAGGGKPG